MCANSVLLATIVQVWVMYPKYVYKDLYLQPIKYHVQLVRLDLRVPIRWAHHKINVQPHNFMLLALITLSAQVAQVVRLVQAAPVLWIAALRVNIQHLEQVSVLQHQKVISPQPQLWYNNSVQLQLSLALQLRQNVLCVLLARAAQIK